LNDGKDGTQSIARDGCGISDLLLNGFHLEFDRIQAGPDGIMEFTRDPLSLILLGREELCG
jgi:hypothetical protein